MNRRPIFQAIKAFLRSRDVSDKFTMDEVRAIDAAIDEALGQIVVTAPPTSTLISSVNGFRLSAKGQKLMHSFEGCKLAAYPDPGSRDGHPWTIGWGSTGPGIAKGVTWTQAQADARFAADIDAKYGKAVNEMVKGYKTTQHQFDALVSLCYNIGIAALRGSTVMRKHKAGDYKAAADAFAMWVKNDGKFMKGLLRRRLAEADLYDDV